MCYHLAPKNSSAGLLQNTKIYRLGDKDVYKLRGMLKIFNRGVWALFWRIENEGFKIENVDLLLVA